MQKKNFISRLKVKYGFILYCWLYSEFRSACSETFMQEPGTISALAVICTGEIGVNINATFRL